MAKKVVLEEAFEQLDEIVMKLQEGELSLEDSMKAYQEGMKLVASCKQSIDQIEKKLIVVNEKCD